MLGIQKPCTKYYQIVIELSLQFRELDTIISNIIISQFKQVVCRGPKM